MNNYLIGVDIGTGGTKAGIFDEKGQQLAKAYKESNLRHPEPGLVEQDMEDFYMSVIGTIKEIIKKSGVDPVNVAAIALDGQMSGIGTIDKNWEPVTRYDNWLDIRCEPFIEVMQEKAGKKIFEKAGAPPTYSHGPKILWWKENHPDIFKKIDKFIVPSSYVAGKMAGLKGKEAFIDYTYLHFTCLADNENKKWDKDLCRFFDIPVEKLPRIVEPDTIVGKMTKKAARDCNLIEGIPIVAGAGDTTTTYLGAGIVEPGIIFDVAGTASVFASCTESFSPDIEYGTIMCSRSVIKGLWNPIAFINGGGLCLRWFRDEIARKESIEAKNEDKDPYNYLNQQAAAVSPGSDNLIFIPHFGGRVLPPSPNLRGSWVGLSWGQKKASLYRSILESIAYEYYYYYKIKKQLYPETEFKEVRVLGGGSKSELWNQIKSDVLNIPYVKVVQEEPAILGSAIIAGKAVGIFDSIKETSTQFVDKRKEFTPRKDYHTFYREYAETYIDLIENLKDSYNRLNKLNKLSPPGKK
ncbi:MAG: xylulokinase [Halanaerobiales bacterium]